MVQPHIKCSGMNGNGIFPELRNLLCRCWKAAAAGISSLLKRLFPFFLQKHISPLIKFFALLFHYRTNVGRFLARCVFLVSGTCDVWCEQQFFGVLQVPPQRSYCFIICTVWMIVRQINRIERGTRVSKSNSWLSAWAEDVQSTPLHHNINFLCACPYNVKI